MSVHETEAAASVQSATLVLPLGDSGGDFQQVDETDARTVALVGDVTGKGEDAAPYADHVCRHLNQRIASFDDPAVLLEDLNAMICADESFDRFVTACVVIVDHVSWSASWAFAGHLPPHWLDTGVPIDGATPGLPLGVARKCGAVSASRRPLRPGEGMLLFTDGLEDVLGPGGDRFGSVRVTHALARQLHSAAPEDVVGGLKDLACEFGSGVLYDDLCLVSFRVS